MRTSKIAALVGMLAGLAWIASAALSWDEVGLKDPSPILWWVGLGLFSVASAFTGYASVTRSPLWLKAIVFFGAGALGGSVLSALDIEMSNAYLVLAILGGALVVLGLVGLVVGRGGDKAVAAPADAGAHGRRAAR